MAACGGGGGGDDGRSSSQAESATANTGNDTGSSGSDGNGTSNPDGGTSSSPSGNAGGGTPGNTPPSSGAGGGTPPSSGSGDSGGNTGSPTAPAFSAQLVSAPPEEPPASDEPQQFIVSGTNLGNVELVSAKDETIVYGRFTISDDKTRATLPWDYGTFHNGKAYDTYRLRILAWDVPPGESGTRIEVMAPRTFRGIYNPGCQPCGGEAP